VRTCVFLFLVASLVGCGDESSARLAGADALTGDDAGCVVDASPTDWTPTLRTLNAGTQTGIARTAWPQRTVTVRPGDSLRKIARELYGDERLWKAIRDANPSKVGRDGAINVGATLVVPFDGI